MLLPRSDRANPDLPAALKTHGALRLTLVGEALDLVNVNGAVPPGTNIAPLHSRTLRLGLVLGF